MITWTTNPSIPCTWISMVPILSPPSIVTVTTLIPLYQYKTTKYMLEPKISHLFNQLKLHQHLGKILRASVQIYVLLCFILLLSITIWKKTLIKDGELQVDNVRRDLTENQTLPSVLLWWIDLALGGVGWGESILLWELKGVCSRQPAYFCRDASIFHQIEIWICKENEIFHYNKLHVPLYENNPRQFEVYRIEALLGKGRSSF